jgi:hypothetical protein
MSSADFLDIPLTPIYLESLLAQLPIPFSRAGYAFNACRTRKISTFPGPAAIENGDDPQIKPATVSTQNNPGQTANCVSYKA